MLNILKTIIIIYLFFKIIRKDFFKNIYSNIKYKNINFVKIKNKRIKKIKIFHKKILYFGYIFCFGKCSKIVKNIKNIKDKKKIFIFSSINKYENSYIIEKFLNKIKKNNIYGLNNHEKKINIISKNFKLIYKYKKNKINHSDILYKIKKNTFINENKKKFF